MSTVDRTPIEFFLDPICPWAWLTSRWVLEVAAVRPLDVRWKAISLLMINEGRDYATEFPEGYPELHAAGLAMLRLVIAARSLEGGEAAGRLYTELGTRVHVGSRYAEARAQDRTFFEEALTAAGLPGSLADAASSVALDEVIRAESELALGRAGREVGTPVLTFDPGTDTEASFFGPVISRVPRGPGAVELWDAVMLLARTPGFCELKRSIREWPQMAS